MQRKATIKDVARLANVSVGTVSRVLNNPSGVKEANREAVLSAMHELGYRPNSLAQGLKAGQTRTIGVMTQFVSSPHFAGIMEGILQTLNNNDYSVLFADGMFEPTIEYKVIEHLLSHRIDGLIIAEGRLGEDKLIELSEQVPLVIVGRKVPTLVNHCIWLDQMKGAYKATCHLIDLGHRDIVHIVGIPYHQAAQDRRDGYLMAMRDSGIGIHDHLIVQGEFVQQSGVVTVEGLLATKTPFSAIFAGNDQMALGASIALYRRGIRVPKDVSVIGFDDQQDAAFVIPPLTTIRQPSPEMGAAAANAMLNLLAGETLEPLEIPAELVIRESAMLKR